MKIKIFFTIFIFFIINVTISYAVPNNYNGKGSIIISKNMLEELFEYFIGLKAAARNILISETNQNFTNLLKLWTKSFINGL